MELAGIPSPAPARVRLRLYIARSTPNSVRAEFNLSVVLKRLDGSLPTPEVEVVDVFLEPKRAMTDCVVVTPTLIGLAADRRIMLIGDLADQNQVQRALQELLTSAPPP